MTLALGKLKRRKLVDSILFTIKEMLGITKEYTHFDIDIITHINSAIGILTQIGVGEPNGFFIKNELDTWESYIGSSKNLELIKSFIYLKVKLLFDPPLSSAAIESINKMISEFEWRISVTVDPSNSIFSGGQ